ncbi:hypothetical protein BDW74DRAFT_7598 [Aspergillus multicolor]|uniref:uncharacterized protein n=1 Tax=Aspergillus multicolor TaxID=41759 RepID=UPI003CCE120B
MALQSTDPLRDLARQLPTEVFSTYKNLVKRIERQYEALLEDGSRDQYLAFTSMSAVAAERLSRQTKYCRFTYNSDTGLLIARIIPDSAHQVAIRSFDFLVFLELDAMNILNELLCYGSATVKVGSWNKEADTSWAPGTPVSTRNLSFVVEVALLEIYVAPRSRCPGMATTTWISEGCCYNSH